MHKIRIVEVGYQTYLLIGFVVKPGTTTCTAELKSEKGTTHPKILGISLGVFLFHSW